MFNFSVSKRELAGAPKEGCNSAPYSGALRSAPEEAKKTPEHSGTLRKSPENIPEEVPPESIRRGNFYSGGLRKSSGVFRSSVKSTPEPSGMFFPEDSGGSQK